MVSGLIRYNKPRTAKEVARRFSCVAVLTTGIIASVGCKETIKLERQETISMNERTEQLREIRESNLRQLDAYRALYLIVLEIPKLEADMRREDLTARLNEVSMFDRANSRVVLVEVEEIRRILNSENGPSPMQLAIIRERFHQRGLEIARNIAFLNSLTDAGNY